MGAIHNIAENCVDCNVCVGECGFLQEHGTPGKISERFMSQRGEGGNHIPFQCNLCNLCLVVCPQQLDCSSSFLEMRRTIQLRPEKEIVEHRSICAYEKWGSSSLFSLHLLPEECTTIFFPGCTLAATRASVAESTYHYLETFIPHIGITLHCCARPSHDLGRHDIFHQRFTRLVDILKRQRISKIITACPSCYDTFKRYVPELETVTVYEVLAANPPETEAGYLETVSIHDACATRFIPEVHDSVRQLVAGSGASVLEMKHCREKALCCGEGAAASFVAPVITGKWKDIRKSETGGRHIITYCAGCSSTFGKALPNTHLLDLLFRSEKAIIGKEKVTKAPFTYLARLLLKKRLKRADKTARSCKDGKHEGKGITARILLLLTILGVAGALHFTGVDQCLDMAHIEELLALCKECPPSLYILILSLAPVFFMPGFPFVMAGGILYGHTWGLVYAMTGATLGAGLSFLLSRYIANQWVSSALSDTKWSKLHEMTITHGWKIVVVLRLVPLFPYTPLNYGLGLTNIKFSHYIIATFLGILPACAAFILFSSSLLDLLKGSLSLNFIAGAFLLFFVSLIPVIYKKFRQVG